MKKLALVALAATSILATPAAAQNFAGFYIGVHGGYVDGTSNADGTLLPGGWFDFENQARRDLVGDFIDAELSPEGWAYGGQVGFNHQMGNVVIGVEGDFTKFESADEIATKPPLTSVNVIFNTANGVDLKHQFSVRARAGIVVSENTLIYATGGWSWVKADYASSLIADNGTPAVPGDDYVKAGFLRETTDGWILGGGLEHLLTSQIGLKFEFTLTDQGHVVFGNDHVLANFLTHDEITRQSLKVQKWTAGFNFHF